jgi:hypothetical protein
LTKVDFGEQIQRRLDELNPGERRLAQLRLERILRRREALKRFPSPGHIARFIQPDTVQTTMMTALDQVAIAADAGFQRRWIISTPPQEGKTMRMGTAVPLWLLMRDPTRRIVIASYEQSVAARSTLAVRQAIETYGGGYKGDRASAHQEDQFGLILDPDRAKQANWNLTDVPGRRSGGMIAVGVGGALTGRSADVMIIDDAVKGPQQAGSPQQRQQIWDWYQSVASTRLSPGAMLIVIGTRWHEDDLIGRLIAQDEETGRPQFHQLIIPAVAKTNDPLGRKPGEYLTSTRGRTAADWEQKRREVGEWVWAALYDADPAPLAGGVFQKAWIHRVAVAPELSRTEVFVDPADNEGDGDEAGVVTMARGANGEFYLLADDSGHMTVGKWFRKAFLAALRHNATAVRYERSLSQLRKAARQAWKDILRDARKLHELDPYKSLNGQRARVPDEAIIHVAMEQLVRDDAEPAEKLAMEKALRELWPLVPAVLALPETGIPVKAITAKGSKTFRAQMVAPLHEYGKVHHVGLFAELVHQLVSWKESQDSPDRMDAYVHGLTELSRSDGVQADSADATAEQALPLRPGADLGQMSIRRQGASRGRY